MQTSVDVNCLAQTGVDSSVGIIVGAILTVVIGLVLTRARARGKRSLGALLLLGALAFGGLAPAATPALAATAGTVCVEEPTPSPTPAAEPLALVFEGEPVLSTAVEIETEVSADESVELNNGVGPAPGPLARELTVCEDGANPARCVTFPQGSAPGTLKTLLLGGADKKLSFTSPTYPDVYIFTSEPTSPFSPVGTFDWIVSPQTVTSKTFSNGSTIYFSLIVARG